MSTILRVIALITSTILLSGTPLNAQFTEVFYKTPYVNDFELSNLMIPSYDIQKAGPSRDGIPAIDHPEFLDAEEANFLADEAPVLGIYRNGIAKAYPIQIIGYHEIVNDQFGEEQVAITFSILCNSGIAYSASLDGNNTEFGVSGLIYNSNALLYDRNTESLWSQVLGQAVSGPASGKQLEKINTFHTTWGAWKEQYPSTRVLSTNTGHERNYKKSPAAYYKPSKRLLFPVKLTDNSLPLREKVIGLEIDGQFKAYPLSFIRNNKQGLVEDYFAGLDIEIHYNHQAESAYITDKNGEVIPAYTMYWFAWYTFHPETSIFLLNDGQLIEHLLAGELVWRAD